MLAHQKDVHNPNTDDLCRPRDCGSVGSKTLAKKRPCKQGYGPALLLGSLLGGAILLDDLITPERKGPSPPVSMFHHGDGFDDPTALSRSDGHNVWVIKGDDPFEAEIRMEIRIELASEDHAPDEEQLMMSPPAISRPPLAR